MTTVGAEPLSLDRIELLVLRVPQVEVFRSAIGERTERRVLLVRCIDEEGAWGIGEASCRDDPFYSGEFVDGASHVIERFIAPSVKRVASVAELVEATERIRGWPATVATVLDAGLDLIRRRGGRDGLDGIPRERERVPVGVSLGLFDSTNDAIERIAREIERGYQRIKLKINPVVDLEQLAEVRREFPSAPIGFDANGSFRASDMDRLALLSELEPLMLEQPFPVHRLDLCSELRHRAPSLRICLDESVASFGQLISAQRLGALDELNLKPGRVGGQLKALKMIAWCRDEDLPVWIGGMFETGIGRLRNLRYAARVEGASAHDLSPSQRYFSSDIITPAITMALDGTIDLGEEAPAILDEEAIDRFLERRIILDLE